MSKFVLADDRHGQTVVCSMSEYGNKMAMRNERIVERLNAGFLDSCELVLAQRKIAELEEKIEELSAEVEGD